MPDALEVIARAISEHHSIREHVKLAGDTVNDIEALFTLQKAHSGWSQEPLKSLVDKQKQMQQALSFLDKGLKNHFAFEEKAFPPLFGDLLMRALLNEHHEISKQIEMAKATLGNIKLEGIERRELFSQKSAVQTSISQLCQAVEEHAQHEEIILTMMKKALEKTGLSSERG